MQLDVERTRAFDCKQFLEGEVTQVRLVFARRTLIRARDQMLDEVCNNNGRTSCRKVVWHYLNWRFI
jgi:hypothetical protein